LAPGKLIRETYGDAIDIKNQLLRNTARDWLGISS